MRFGYPFPTLVHRIWIPPFGRWSGLLLVLYCCFPLYRSFSALQDIGLCATLAGYSSPGLALSRYVPFMCFRTALIMRLVHRFLARVCTLPQLAAIADVCYALQGPVLQSRLHSIQSFPLRLCLRRWFLPRMAEVRVHKSSLACGICSGCPSFVHPICPECQTFQGFWSLDTSYQCQSFCFTICRQWLMHAQL